MDTSALIPLITPAIAAAIAYLRDQAAAKAGEKAAKADPKAQQVLANVEQDPTDDDYQNKLIKETARLASTDSAFAQELKILAEQVTVAQPGSTVQTINNQAPNQGAQGVFNAPVSFGAAPAKRQRLRFTIEALSDAHVQRALEIETLISGLLDPDRRVPV